MAEEGCLDSARAVTSVCENGDYEVLLRNSCWTKGMMSQLSAARLCARTGGGEGEESRTV